MLYYLLLVFASLQLQVYLRLKHESSLVADGMREIGEVTWIGAAVNVFAQILAALIAFWQHNGLLFNYVAFGVVALLGGISVIRLGYLVILLVGLHIHQYVPTWNHVKEAGAVFRRFWYMRALRISG